MEIDFCSDEWPPIGTVSKEPVQRLLITVLRFLGPINNCNEAHKFFRAQWVVFDSSVPDAINQELEVSPESPLIVLRVPGQEDERAVFSWQTGPEDGKIHCFHPLTGMKIIVAPHLLQPCHNHAPVPGDLLEQWLQLWLKAD